MKIPPKADPALRETLEDLYTQVQRANSNDMQGSPLLNLGRSQSRSSAALQGDMVVAEARILELEARVAKLEGA